MTGVQACLLLALLVLGGCDAARSFDMGAGQPPIFFDELTVEDRRNAAREMASALARGVEDYRLAPGDRIEVLFHIDRRGVAREYTIGVGDKLDIDVYAHPDATRAVAVRPDGKISLPRIGDVQVAGLSPKAAGDHIARLYSDIFVDPDVTVIVRDFVTNLDDFREVVTTAAQGRAKELLVQPDGRVTLPLLPPIKVAGMRTEDVKQIVDRHYDTEFGNVSATVRLSGLSANQVFVFGEVRQPGPITLTGPRTVLQILGSAGGPLSTAALDEIRVLYWQEDEARIRQLNLNRIVEDLRLEEDFLVPPNASVFVPPTWVTKANRWVDQYIRQLFLFNGTSLGISYELGPGRDGW